MAWRYNPRTTRKNSKYGAEKAIIQNSDGSVMQFDSKKEAKRYVELRFLEQGGVIKNLERQVKFVLIPAQREPDGIGVRGGKIKGKLIEREVAYIADFVYIENGEKVVEDVKGYKGGTAYDLFKIKRKLMLFVHGIRVKEV